MDKIDTFIKIYCENRYLVLLGHNCYDKICDIWNLKFDITDSINHNFAVIRIDSYNSSPIKKIFIIHNVIILIKSAVNKYDNYHYNIFLGKGTYKDKSNTEHC